MFFGYGDTVSEQSRQTDEAIATKERHDWEREHLPPLGDGTMEGTHSTICKHCGGEIAIRNPTGKCDHMYWPDMLTDEAKRANGFRLVTRQVWERVPNAEAHRQPDAQREVVR